MLALEVVQHVFLQQFVLYVHHQPISQGLIVSLARMFWWVVSHVLTIQLV